MFDVGTGLAVLGIGGPIMAAIIKFAPARRNGYVMKEVCDERFQNVLQRLQRIELKLDRYIEKEAER